MARYLLRRLALYLALVATAASVAYLLAAVALNPRANYENRNPPPPASVVDARLDDYNLNDKTPVLQRYGRWISGLVHGDLGRSTEGASINEQFSRRIGVSLRLLVLGSILGAIVGVLAGAYGAVRQYRSYDRVSTATAFVLLSTPTVVLAILVKVNGITINRAVGKNVLPVSGPYRPGVDLWSWDGIVNQAQHLILPSLVFVLFGFAFYSRYQRSTMLDVLGSDFLRTAQAKGLRRRRALFKHGLRVALIPMVTFFSYQFTLLFVGSTFVETQFGWHGMGEWFVTSIQRNDVNAVAAITVFVAVLVLLAGILADFAHAALDPRVRVR